MISFIEFTDQLISAPPTPFFALCVLLLFAQIQKEFLRILFLFSTFVGNQHNDRGEQIDTKSDQWFGATVTSAGVDGPLVVSLESFRFIYPGKKEQIAHRKYTNFKVQNVKVKLKSSNKLFAQQLCDTWYVSLLNVIVQRVFRLDILFLVASLIFMPLSKKKTTVNQRRKTIATAHGERSVKSKHNASTLQNHTECVLEFLLLCFLHGLCEHKWLFRNWAFRNYPIEINFGISPLLDMSILNGWSNLISFFFVVYLLRFILISVELSHKPHHMGYAGHVL